MSTSSNSKSKRAGKAAAIRNKKWLIGVAIGTAVIVIAGIAIFALSQSSSQMKLKVEDLVVGTGREAKIGDTLIAHYTGWVYGKSKSQPFDSSLEFGKPIEFVLGKGKVIRGWDRGLAGMKVGGKRKLTIPSDLAYGADGTFDGRIPPNAALVFEVELLDVITPLAELPPTSVKELKVEDLFIGTGAEARAGTIVSVHYTGWIEDGTEFDSSRDSGKPIEFVLGKGQVVAGWEQGILGMKVGGIRKLTIPPDLGYGAKGVRNYVPPNAALIFEVELMDVRTPSPTMPPTSVKMLKVEDLVVGTGDEARNGNTLVLNFTGWLEDGTQFDSSYDYGEPIEFVLGKGQVIAGWEQGLLGMKVGGKRKLTIPPDLAYGADGHRNYIPPNAALIFEVELIAVR